MFTNLFRLQGSGLRVQGAGLRVQGSGRRAQGSGLRVQGSGLRAQGSGFRLPSFPVPCALRLAPCALLPAPCALRLAPCATLLFLILTLLHAPSHAQEPRTEYSAEFSIAAGTPELPFWLYANSDARLRPGSSGNGLASFGFRHRFFEENNPIQVRTGADLFSRISDRQNSLHFQQFYVEADYGFFQLKAGRFYETIGLNEQDLSVGSMMISRNATPFPKIRLSTPEYVSVPGTSDFLQFSFRYSEGILESDRLVKNARVHQKYLYLRLNPIDELFLYGGVIHNFMWGGKHPVREPSVSTIREYLQGVFGIPRDSGPTPPGNSIGAYDFAAEYRFNDFSVKVSRLFYLEDLISARFRSPWDGKWGLHIEKHEKVGLIHSFLYEHVNAIRQDSRGGQPPGRARYYWHWFYEQGWSYNQSKLGIPLFFSDNPHELENNMVVAHHIGVTGNIFQNVQYKSLVTYSRNYGVCSDVIVELSFNECLIEKDFNLDEVNVVPLSELRKNQYSLMLRTEYHLPDIPNLQLNLTISLDIGELYRHRAGIMAGIRWNGRI